MKKAVFNDAFGQTEGVISGRISQYRRPVPDDGVKKLNYIFKTQDVLGADGRIKALPNNYDKFVKRYTQWKVGDVMAVEQSYKSVWQMFNSDDYKSLCECKPGWRTKYMAKAEFLPYVITINELRLERLRDMTCADALRCGVVMAGDTGEYTNAGLDPETFKTAEEAYIAAFFKERGLQWGDNPWCWVYEFNLSLNEEIADLLCR
jgi:hypothetical protein